MPKEYPEGLLAKEAEKVADGIGKLCGRMVWLMVVGFSLTLGGLAAIKTVEFLVKLNWGV